MNKPNYWYATRVTNFFFFLVWGGVYKGGERENHPNQIANL